MKRSLYALCIAILLLAGCDHDYRYNRRIVTAHFWTSSYPDDAHHLFINGKDKGILPYSLTVPDIDRGSDRKTLTVPMKSGRFTIEVKNGSGKIVYREKFRLKLRLHGTTINSSTDDERGGTKLTYRGNHVIKEIFFDE